MEYIGKRISVKRTDDEVSIVILSSVDKKKNMLLFVWFLLWTISGIIVMSQFFLVKDENTRAAMLVWMAFWAYFEYKIFKVYFWRKYGVEKIKIRQGKLFYKRDVAGKGKIKEYPVNEIKQLRVKEASEKSFAETLNQSYWVIAGEALLFDHNNRDVKFGIQLDDADANAVLKVIKGALK